MAASLHHNTGPFLFQHPQIQKESQYIKYLCCDDAWTMDLWVTGIRIAKVNLSPHSLVAEDPAWAGSRASPCPVFSLRPQYGSSLHDNYKEAEKKAAVTSVWANRSTASSSTPSSSTPSTPQPAVKG